MIVDEKFRAQLQNPLLVRQGELEALRAAIKVASHLAFSVRRKLADGASVEHGRLILGFDREAKIDEFFRDSTEFLSEAAELSVFDRQDLEAELVDQLNQELGNIRAQGMRD